MRPAIQDVEIIKNGRPVRDAVAVEEPLEIRVGRVPIVVTMRTPGHDEELAAGLLWTEGLIERPEHVESARHCVEADAAAAGNVLIVELADGVAIDAERLRRTLPSSGACGLCGKTRIEQVRVRGRPLVDRFKISKCVLTRLPDTMRAAQGVFAQTGGLHAAGLFDAAGRLLCVREDIGRHNAVDKIVGWAVFAERLPLHAAALLVSGRAGFEIVQKAYIAGVPLVASVSAPSSLAVALAVETGMTLAGFVRDGDMNIYAHAHRIVG